MATAICDNTSCDRGEWTLQKHPADYAGGVSCPDCGTTRVTVDDGGQQQERRAPERRQRQEGQQRAPARRDRQRGGGAGAEDVIALLDDDVDNRKRADAAGSVLGAVGGIAKKLINYQEDKREAAEQRAEEVELQESNLPECKAELDDGTVCAYQFGPEDIGISNNRVRCPRCDSVYDITGPA